jgi:hypothetical protein
MHCFELETFCKDWSIEYGLSVVVVVVVTAAAAAAALVVV